MRLNEETLSDMGICQYIVIRCEKHMEGVDHLLRNGELYKKKQIKNISFLLFLQFIRYKHGKCQDLFQQGYTK